MNYAKRFAVLAVLLFVVLLNNTFLTGAFAAEVDGEVTQPAATEVPATEPPATEPPATEPPATEPPATEPPATTAATTPRTNYVSRPDYSELTRQIAIAEGLNQIDYTTTSWAALQEALTSGENALKSYRQKTVDAAEQALKDAIAGLVKMDYTDLWAILMEVGALDKPDEVYDLWSELVLAVEKGRELLSCGDQAAVDAGTDEIYEALEQVKEYLEEIEKPQVVVKEVEVEVPPTGDYCNIVIHRIWPVAFAVSLILNLALFILIVSILRKKQKQMDGTPLVDYDIDDDDFDV